MAVKNRIVVKSNFRAVTRAAQDAMRDAIQKATDTMEDTAETRIEQTNNRLGYNLPGDVEQQTSGLEGRIWHPDWFMKFFEYGTIHIAASPFLRPAHRKGRARLIGELDDNFEGWIRRKARMR